MKIDNNLSHELHVREHEAVSPFHLYIYLLVAFRLFSIEALILTTQDIDVIVIGFVCVYVMCVSRY